MSVKSELFDINNKISWAEMTKGPDDFVVARRAVNNLEGYIEHQIKKEVARQIAGLITADQKQLFDIIQTFVSTFGPILGPHDWAQMQAIIRPLVDQSLIEVAAVESYWEAYDASHLRSDLGV